MPQGGVKGRDLSTAVLGNVSAYLGNPVGSGSVQWCFLHYWNSLHDEPWVISRAVLGLGDAHPPVPNTSVDRNFLVAGQAAGVLGGDAEGSFWSSLVCQDGEKVADHELPESHKLCKVVRSCTEGM